MKPRRVLRDGRVRLALSHMRPVLADDEHVEAWAHVVALRDGGHGIVTLTRARCFVHWTARDQADVVVGWNSVRAWGLQLDALDGPVLALETQQSTVALRLPVSSRAQARKASALLWRVAALSPPQAGGRYVSTYSSAS